MLSASFMKLFTEYNSTTQKLLSREKHQKRKQELHDRMQALQQQKQLAKREQAPEIDIKISAASKAFTACSGEVDVLTRDYYNTIVSLLDNIHVIMSPVVNNFVSINALFFSKSQSTFSPIGAVDPMSSLSEKQLTRQSISANKSREQVLYESNAGGLAQTYDMKDYGSYLPENNQQAHLQPSPAPIYSNQSNKEPEQYDQYNDPTQKQVDSHGLASNDNGQQNYDSNYDQAQAGHQLYNGQQQQDPEYDALQDDYSNNGYNYYGMTRAGDYNEEYDYYTIS